MAYTSAGNAPGAAAAPLLAPDVVLTVVVTSDCATSSGGAAAWFVNWELVNVHAAQRIGGRDIGAGADVPREGAALYLRLIEVMADVSPR